MVATVINWIKQKYEAIRQKYEAKYQAVKEAILSPGKPKTSEPESGAAAARRKLGEAVDSLPDYFAKLASSFSENAQLKRFIDVGADFMKSGHYAGLWGMREPEIGDLAEMHVRITKSLIDEECESNQRKLSSQVKILETIKDNAERDYDDKNAYYEKLKRAYQYNPRQFSLVLGCIYGFVALVLVLADIPLALELTRDGFNLKMDLDNAIGDLFQFGTPDGFFHFFRVLTSNWEVFFLATGVAFCTIYIKIFYDDFIGVPLENLLKKASEPPTTDYEEWNLRKTERPANNGVADIPTEAFTDKKQITARFNRLWWCRFVVKLFILLTLLFTIGVLGTFRYQVIVANGIAPPTYTTLFTFCLMTMIFPIISGICASLSLSSFHNWYARLKAAIQNALARKTLIRATDEFRVKLEEEERNSGFINWLADPETIDQLRNYLIRCYESGFKFGYLYPEWTYGGDLFTRAEALRNRNLTDPNIPLIGFTFQQSQDTVN